MKDRRNPKKAHTYNNQWVLFVCVFSCFLACVYGLQQTFSAIPLIHSFRLTLHEPGLLCLVLIRFSSVTTGIYYNLDQIAICMYLLFAFLDFSNNRSLALYMAISPV